MLTAAQLEQRKKSIGSSDMSAILGINRFKTAYDVWLEKTGKLLPQDTFQVSEAADAGNRFERSVLSWASEELGKLRRNVYMVAPGGLPIHAYTDAVVISTGNPVEAKTGGLFGPLWGAWGEPGSGDVPEPYIIQAHMEMLCAEREICHMPAFLGGRGFQLYHIPLCKDLMDIITERAANFWNEYVLKDIPPPDVYPSLPIMSKVRRTPGKRVPVDRVDVELWRNADFDLKLCQTTLEAAKSRVLAALGDAEASEPVELGGIMQEVTFLEQSRESIDGKMLRDKFPEAAAACTKTTTFRVPRIRKVKATKEDEKV